MAEYDEDLIRKFADRLYARAGRTVFLHVLSGILIGLAAGWILGVSEPVAMMLWGTGYDPQTLTMAGGAIAFGLAGLALGMRRSFLMKLQAQLALCQMQIERNTRGTPRQGDTGGGTD